MSSELRTSLSLAPVAVASAALLGALVWPLLFTDSGFAGDFGHHLWLMWHQSLSIQATGLPSLFLHSGYSVFYPTYAFYGGTLYAIGGALSLALGGAPVSAYVLVYLLDFLAAFGGWYWLARTAGVRRWPAMVPGLVFVTSTYYILVVYSQGDWPEFTGISMIPLIAAAGLDALTAPRWRGASAAALAVGCVLFFGSHNLTMLYGLTFLALVGVGLVVCVPAARGLLSRRGVLRVAAVAVPAALVSAWYLLPALAYESFTHVGQSKGSEEEVLGNGYLVGMKHIFALERAGIPGTLPVLAIAWVIIGIAVLPWRGSAGAWKRVLLICCALAFAFGLVMTHTGLVLALPRPYRLIQWTYRLEAYVLLGLSGAILAGLVLARQGPLRARLWAWLALPVCAFSVIGAVSQVRSDVRPSLDRYSVFDSRELVESGPDKEFVDQSGRVIPAQHLASVQIPPEAIDGDRVSFTTDEPPGTLLATNIGAGPYLVHLTGARAVGVEAGAELMVIEARSHSITVSPASGLPVVLGRALSVAGAAILLGELLVFALAAYRRRSATVRARPSSSSSAEKSIEAAGAAAAPK